MRRHTLKASFHSLLIGAAALAVAFLGGCPDTTTSPPTADIGVDSPTGPCPGGAADNGCGGCGDLPEAIGRPGTLCLTDDGFDGVSGCDGIDAVVCSPLAYNGCGGTATLDGTAGTSCGTCGRGVWTCDTPDSVSCVGGDAGVNGCGGCSRLEAAPTTTCGACGGTWQCASDGDSVACLDDTQNACGGCAVLTGDGPGALCNGNGTVACDGVDATVCAPPGNNACGGSTVLEMAPGAVCGPCGDGLGVCVSAEATECIGASLVNACGGCGFLADAPGDECAPVGVWSCENEALECVFSGGNGCGGTTPLVNSADPTAEVVLGVPCGMCDAGVVACLGFEGTQCAGGGDEDSYVWPDVDEDGFGDANATPTVECTPGPATAPIGGDCDDSLPGTNPGTTGVEVCDGVDNDCDGLTDEGTAGEACTADTGCGGLTICEGAAGLSCDAVALLEETCDGVDNDCDGEIDEADAQGCTTLYPDTDSDDFGVTDDAACLCPLHAEGYVPVGGDCDDTRADVKPGAFELCNTVDDDCDGTTDQGAADALVWYPDTDEDTFGHAPGGQLLCEQPAGWVAEGNDCDDDAPGVHPSTADSLVDEICDGIDNDCDGATDPDVSVGAHAFRLDFDDDTFGAGATIQVQCYAPEKWVHSIEGIGIAAGPTQALALGTLGELAAWGAANGSGEDPLLTGRIGLEVTLGSDAVAMGDGFFVATQVDGTVRSWGIAEAPPEAVDVMMLAAGDGHVLGLLADGTVLAWGDNTEGQTDVVAGLATVEAVAAGAGHSLALRTDGTVAAWGRNVELQSDVPAGLTGVAAVAAGGAHSVALLDDGTVVGWGLNTDGQTDLAGLTGVAAVAAGGAHTLALLEDGTVVAVGSDSSGQASVPNGMTEVVAVAAGDEFSMALRDDGTVWVWGSGAAGEDVVPDSLRRDCKDADPLIHPNADDVCDFVDNDCDRAIDMDDSQGTTVWYPDFDVDGHGDLGAKVLGCTEATLSASPFKYLQTPADDCDDGNPESYPGAPEIVADGTDQNCDGREFCYIDEDNDGAAANFYELMASEPDDFQCSGTSTKKVVLEPGGGFTLVTVAEVDITPGDSGFQDCDDTSDYWLYIGCQCIPNCDGRECGDNGCGLECGLCTGGDTCSADGQCVP